MAESHRELSEDDLIELSLLRDFETDALIEAEILGANERLSRPLDQELVIRFGELDFNVTAGVSYPTCSVTWHVENHTLSRTSVDSLRGILRQIVDVARVTNNFSRWQNREVECEMGIFDPIQVVLQLTQAIRSHVGHSPFSMPTRKPETENDNYLPFITRPSIPIDTSTALEQETTTAFQLLRKTPKEICASIPSYYRVLHIEPVLRGNLVLHFDKQQRELGEVLSKLPSHQLRRFVPSPHKKGSKTDLIEHLLRPRLTFHGTLRDDVSSIIRYGFLRPGTTNPKTKEEHMYNAGVFPNQLDNNRSLENRNNHIDDDRIDYKREYDYNRSADGGAPPVVKTSQNCAVLRQGRRYRRGCNNRSADIGSALLPAPDTRKVADSVRQIPSREERERIS
ncbi:hypothetical protein F4679DRAFT_596418 [Xylaria curta]|nr:hypothetical protein F4679DRAFT_596418 [Xylaria curta]